MESSDDEAEAAPLSVSNYYFVDDNEAPLSFQKLPIQWSESDNHDRKEARPLFLRGTADNGLEKIYRPVVAWRFDLSNVKPEISVLSKEKEWIVLQKPRRSYEEIVRSILVTVQCLSYAKRNAEAAGKGVWDHLCKAFSMYEVRPSESDLRDHASLISEALCRDDALAKSKFIAEFLKEKPTKKKLFDEDIQATTKPGFIVDDAEEYDIIEDEDDSDDDDDANLFDSVCAFCDNGGELLCCEGRCLRSFHPTVEDGEESTCESLGFTRDEVNAMPSFFCKNCQYKQHQCFVCGKLGSSDKSSGAEVFPCVSATCGQFYHPHCVAQLIYKDSGVPVEELENKISLGESFTCPIHKCYVCKQGENNKDPKLRFAVCRRCPKSYHKKCLPSDIRFEKTEEDEIVDEEEIETRAWEGLLPNRILIYCTEHEIDEEIKTPIRDHIKFPDVDGKKTTTLKRKTSFEETKRRLTSESLMGRDNSVLKKRKLSSKELYGGRTDPTISEQKVNSGEKVGGNKTAENLLSGLDVSKKVMVNKRLKKEVQSSMGKEDSLGDRLYMYMKGSGSVKFGKQDDIVDAKPSSEKIAKNNTSKASSVAASLDLARKRRLDALMKDAAASIKLEDVQRKHKVPSTHASSNKHAVERNITLGKVEGSVEAVQTALKKLQEGRSIEDAKAVCAPEILLQIYKWKSKLRGYLAPFLHGMRYSSYGRHFTKVEKLEQIADRLCWYAQNGDTIVDFCCGANDFSIIMKKKLEEIGKKCYFKNYDIIQAKDDFYFEKRDWMTVEKDELPPGAKLIMGLNPPFGVKAALANKFIKKALEFQPKLLILIVPPETARPETERLPYDLIWMDDRFLSGKSFYLPGSIDENDKQMDQWNKTTPPLYLWSRPDWAGRHRAIAQKESQSSMSHGSVEGSHAVEDKDENGKNLTVPNGRLNTNSKDYVSEALAGEGDKERSSKGNDDRVYQVHETSKRLQNRGRKNKKRSFKGNDDRFYRTSSNDLKNQVNETSERLQNCGRENIECEMVELSPAYKHDGCYVSGEINKERSLSTERQRRGYQHSEPSNSGSSVHFATADGRTAASMADDTRSKFFMSSDEPYLGVTHRLSGGASPVSSAVSGYMRERSETYGPRPYSMEMEDSFRGESDRYAPLRHYGQQSSDMYRSDYLLSHDLMPSQVGSFPSMYGHAHLGSAVDSSYRTTTSAIERYAARLDDTNYPRTSALGTYGDRHMHDLRMSALGAQPPYAYNDPRSYGSMHDPRAPRPGDQGVPFSFAPGSHRSFSNQNSAGWLNE